MGESGSQQHREPDNQADSEMIQFGGLPVRWPFPDVHLPRMPQRPIAVALLAVGLLIGFLGGRLTAHHTGHGPRSILPVSTPIVVPRGDAITMTGARCSVQVGNNLELGLEIMNETGRTATIGAIKATFPLGGLRVIASGIGTCGELPMAQIAPSASLSPGATEWIHITVAVRAGCPGALPVWFTVGYTSARKTSTATLAGFPDLGPVPYRRCQGTDQNTSAIMAIVENSINHSSSW